jgi:hypothetical protein
MIDEEKPFRLEEATIDDARPGASTPVKAGKQGE